MDARIKRLEELSQRFGILYAGMDGDTLNWKPNAETWSVAQVLDHLIRTNTTYFPVIAQLQAGTYRAHWLGKVPGMKGFFGQALLRAMRDGRRKRHKTFPVWEPRQSGIPGTITADFEGHQVELVRQFRIAEQLVLAGAVISSPAKRFIVYDLAVALDIIVAHEERHLLQVQEIVTWLR